LSGDHPYRDLPPAAFWRRAVAGPGLACDPVIAEGAPLTPHDRIATAGSCFAQNIARHLRSSGFHFLVTETAHPIVPEAAAAAASYGVYSARYGNIYTSLQLLQLIERAYWHFTPAEAPWALGGGRFADPFRPAIQPGGFASLGEMEADRAHHLSCVRQMFETLDVFVFTLGLTETWISTEDGAAFPICPGVAGGTFDPARYAFRNLRVGNVTGQMTAFLARLAEVNPAARVILTVSPVPLVATAVPSAHVLGQTIYSKSVLRAAAQELAEDHANVRYFPSYEIVTGPHAANRYFADDLRNVTEEGVARVMALFLKHMTVGDGARPIASVVEQRNAPDVKAWVEVMCEEAMLDLDGVSPAI